MGAVTASAAQADFALDEDSLAGRVALVTGGTRGIGAAISLSLVRRGATVAAGFSANQGAAVAFRETLRQAGSEASIHQGNVGDPEHCPRVDEVIERTVVDILVNNAGVTVDRPVSTMTVRLAQGAGQPVRRLLHVPAGARAHARARLRADHQHLLGRRGDRATSARPTTPRRSPACSDSQRRWPGKPRSRSRRRASSTAAGSGSPSTRSPRG